MVPMNCRSCPCCGSEIKYYDTVKRIHKGKFGKTSWICIHRYKCHNCRTIHRELPDDILPFIQYDKEIVRGVVNGWITDEVMGFEDYPCKQTTTFWLAKFASSFMET